MLAIQTNTQGHSKLIDTNKPMIGPKDVLIKTIGCGVCGTDLLKINLNLLNKPTILGHEIIGKIVEKGNEVTNFNLNDKIVVAHHVPCFECHYCKHGAHSMCDMFKKTNLIPGGFAQYVLISSDHLEHTSFKIPDNMPENEALFTEPLACCVRSVDRLPLLQNDTVMITGLGSIGLMMTKLVKRLGCYVYGVDTDPARAEVAKQFGVDKVFCKIDDSLIKTTKEKTNQRGLDGIIFTAGPATLLNDSLNWIRNGGFVNLFSHLAGEKAPIDTSKLYHNELQIITSYSATPESLKKAFTILKDEDLNLRKMLTAYQPNDFEKAVSDMNTRKVLKGYISFTS